MRYILGDVAIMPRVTMDEAQRREDKLDEALRETFPASDPPANTVETGIKVGVVEGPDDRVRDNRGASRFEIVP
jgi:hypothetical protein